MSTSLAQRFASPELRTSLFFFLQFTPPAVASTYAGIWMTEMGLSADEIGTIFALPVFATLLFNLMVGRLADRATDWKQAIVIGCAFSGVGAIGLFFVDEFWGLLIFWTIASVSHGVVTPVADAAAMRMSRRLNLNYSTFRAWGTSGFVLLILFTGFMIGRFGSGLFLPVFIGVGLGRMLMAFALPRFRAQEGEAKSSGGASSLKAVLKPWFVLPLLGWALVFSTHLLLAAFQALLFAKQGIGEDVIGLLIALGAFVEALVFFAFRSFSTRFSARHLMLISAVVSVFRWTMMGLEPVLWQLVLLQMLHGVTFAFGFLGLVRFVADWTHEDIAAEAQSFAALLQGAVSMCVIYLFGSLVEQFGARAYFGSAVVAGLGGLCIVASLILRSRRTEDDEKIRADNGA